MTDPIDRLIAIRDRIDALLAAEQARTDKLCEELSKIDQTLLLADALAVLRAVPTRNMSEGQRQQISGVKDRIRRAMR